MTSRAQRRTAPLAGTAGRAPAVDGLRTVAVGAVVVFHLSEQLLPGGSIGVDIFFVISGFVITTTLLRERVATGRIDLKQFYIRRWLRLMPALAAVAATVLVVALIFPTGPFAGQWVGALFGAAYLMNFARGLGWGDYEDLHLMGHTWSLGIEEQFYILWPAALIGLLLAKRRLALAAWVVLLATPTVIRLLVWAPEATRRIYNLPDTRFDQLLVGAALAYLMTRVPAARIRRVAGALLWPSIVGLFAVVLFIPVGSSDHWSSPFVHTVGYLAVALAAAILVASLVLDERSWPYRLLSHRWVSTFGRRYSYGTYLWHYVIFEAVAWLPVGKPVAVAADLAALGVLVHLSYRFVERPALMRKRRHEVPRA